MEHSDHMGEKQLHKVPALIMPEPSSQDFPGCGARNPWCQERLRGAAVAGGGVRAMLGGMMIFKGLGAAVLALAINGCAAPAKAFVGGVAAAGTAEGNPVLEKRWETVTARLTRAVPRDEDGRAVRWRMRLAPGPAVNAETLPDGRLSVTEPLLAMTREDGELAAVLAHEMAHVTLRHGRDRATAALLTVMGGAAAGWAIAEHGDSGFGESGAVSTGVIFSLSAAVLLPLRRDQEREADRESVRILRRAGYDPAAAARFWERFAAYRAARGTAKGGLWSAHPPDAERIRLLRELTD